MQLAVVYDKPTKETTQNLNQLLQPKSWPYPTLKKDHVIIKVKAFGLNFADVLARKGYYPDAPKFPFVPGYEVSGIIIAIGEDVPTRKPTKEEEDEIAKQQKEDEKEEKEDEGEEKKKR